MALDTLPSIGRIMLLAWLLTLTFYAFHKLLPGTISNAHETQGTQTQSSTLNLLYPKGALVALLLVPLVTYVLGFQVPVPVDELKRLSVSWPSTVVYVLAAVWVAGMAFQFFKLRQSLARTLTLCQDFEPANEQLKSRLRHWQQRLNYTPNIEVLCGGSELAWHFGARPGWAARIILPSAALHWPAGLQDVALLSQLSQLQQGAWRWMVFARLVQCIYWPMPWVSHLVVGLLQHIQQPAWRLAASAYRDPDGWRRDVRNLSKRASTLAPIPQNLQQLRLPNDGEGWLAPTPNNTVAVDGVSFEDKWAGSKRRKRHKESDPYEQAYWLIAVGSILVGVASTLTIVQKSPEFEPRYLNVKWQDQMFRRIQDETSAASPGNAQASED